VTVIEVVEGAGADLDLASFCPKVQRAADVQWLDRLLTQLEQATGLAVGASASRPRIEDARGMTAIDEIAASSPPAGDARLRSPATSWPRST